MVKNCASLAGVLAIAGFIAVDTNAQGPTPSPSTPVALEREAIDLVERVEEVAREVRFHVSRLNELIGTAASAWSHYHHLDTARDLVNGELRPALARLNEIHPQLPGWKQESVDRMIAAAQSLASDASSVYLAKAEQRGVPPVLNADYRRFLRDVSAHVESLVKTADAAHAYASGHLRATEAGLRVAR